MSFDKIKLRKIDFILSLVSSFSHVFLQYSLLFLIYYNQYILHINVSDDDNSEKVLDDDMRNLSLNELNYDENISVRDDEEDDQYSSEGGKLT